MLSSFNDNQKEAISLGLGPAMILAGPGSGKTTVLLQRVRYLIDELHISPKHILVLTFTKNAAEEMKKRAAGVLNLTMESPFFGTFHSYFYSVLKRSYAYRNFSVLTTQQKRKQLEGVLREFYPSKQISIRYINDILTCFSKIKNQAECENEIKSLDFTIEEFQILMAKYNQFNQENDYIDYDDILFLAGKLLKEKTFTKEVLRNEIKYILVDEFQDINRCQYDLIRLLSGNTGNVFVVGDDDQSIYRFRGANDANFSLFEKDFKEAYKVVLNTNYRCPKEVVEISLNLIKHNEKRYVKDVISGKKESGRVWCKKFISRDEEKSYIVNEIKSILKKEDDNIAVLCRTNSQLSYFSERLKKEKISFYIKEKTSGFYEEFTVKPIIGYLMFSCKADRSRKRLFSFLNKPGRYLDRGLFSMETEVDLKRVLLECKEENDRKKLSELCSTLDKLAKMKPEVAIIYILKVIGYETYVLERCSDKENIEKFYANMEELKERGRMYDTIKQWMEFLKTEENIEQKNSIKSIEDGVKTFLYTFHGAKGLEFDNVFIPHLNEGSIPYGKNISQEDLEEERRMFYVALTRSAKNLYISYVENDTKKDTVSRFIKECAVTVSK